MDRIYDVLRQEHQSIRTLMDLVDKTHGASDGRQELFGRLSRLLRAHAATEERVFYSKLLEEPMTRQKAGHSVVEHREAEELLDELAEADMSSSGWVQRFRTLKKAVEHHIDEEEHALFQLSGKVLTEGQKEAMLEDYRKLEQQELSRQ